MKFSSQPSSRLISPPDLAMDLRKMLETKCPNTDVTVLRSAAAHIDSNVRGLLRSQHSVKLGRKPRHWPRQFIRKRPDPVSYSLKTRPSMATALLRLQRAASSGSTWQWAKAWHELPTEAIALLESVGGSEAVWGKVPLQLPLSPAWQSAFSRAGVPLRQDDTRASETKFALNVAGAPIPHPICIRPLIPKAMRLTRKGRPENFWRNIHVAEIVRAFERLTDSKVMMPGHQSGSSRRSGSIIEFLDALEVFYNTRLPKPFGPLHFDVQNSGSAWERIFCLLGRM